MDWIRLSLRATSGALPSSTAPAAGSAGWAQCRHTSFLNQQQVEAQRRAAGMQLIQNMQNRPQPLPTYQMPIRPTVNSRNERLWNGRSWRKADIRLGDEIGAGLRFLRPQ